MSQYLKIFEWLMYASLVAGLLTVMTEDYTAGQTTALFAFIAFVVVLVRLATRKENLIAACLLGTVTIFAILILIADLSGGAVLSLFASDPLPSTGTLILDAIAAALMAVAMAFYLFGGRQVPQP